MKIKTTGIEGKGFRGGGQLFPDVSVLGVPNAQAPANNNERAGSRVGKVVMSTGWVIEDNRACPLRSAL